ncbi:MAG: hypothetical protein C0404_11920, partial [Verrucomicrobia bacterium]|nr:hypothetical protein [Verrucomicrobiota bacterium]
YDSEVQLYYYGYRYYDAATTKWLSRDPLGEQGGLNLTAFCGNDPVNGLDVLGLAPEVGIRMGISVGLDRNGVYLDSLDFAEAFQDKLGNDWQWELGLYQRIQVGRSPGTSVDKNLGIGVDLTTVTFSLTRGEGADVGIPQYSLNSITVSPFMNKFAKSFTWGQAFNMNFTDDDENRFNMNILGFLQTRNADNYFYYANDVDMLPNLIVMGAENLFGYKGKDRYWTAEALLGTVDATGTYLELSWQCFTGDMIDRSKRSKRNIYDQTEAQLNSNRSEWSVRISPSGRPYTMSIGCSSPKFMNPQDWVHILLNSRDELIRQIRSTFRKMFDAEPLPSPIMPGAGFFDFHGYEKPRIFQTLTTDFCVR